MKLMKSTLFIPIISITLSSLTSCQSEEKSDAYGNFEAITITVGSEGTGKLLAFDINEGQSIKSNQMVGIIDTSSLHLEKMALIASLESIDDKLQDASPDIAILVEQKANISRDLDRTRALFEQKAATEKQLEDLEGQMEVINSQIESTRKRIGVANRGILSERAPLEAQIKIIEEKIHKSRIVSPIDGTVLTKVMEPGEFVSYGTPLFKIADLSEIKLRAYTSANLLQKTSLNNEVKVLVDDGEGGLKELSGKVLWISSEAEFTPKTIETKEDRVNLVYAFDVMVKNDGSLRIGMPAEVRF